MKIIVPMAGRGSRLRPHTLTVPKPLIPIAGKPIVHRLVEDIAGVINQKIEEIAFIIHKDFGKKVEEDLIAIAEKLGSKGTICYQNLSRVHKWIQTYKVERDHETTTRCPGS